MSASDDRDADYWLDTARRTAKNPGGWLYVAEMLKDGADKLLDAHLRATEEWQQAFAESHPDELASTLAELQLGPFLTPIYLMLCGLSLENLGKGIAIARDPALVEPDASGKVVSWGHLSRALLTNHAIGFDEQEGELIDRLAMFVQWAGRYPVPRFARELSSRRIFELPGDRDAIDALYQRLHAELVAAAPLHGERLEQERVERGVTYHATLSRLPTIDRDGVVYHLGENESSEVGLATYCGTCHTQLNLAPRTPAAICGCGDFHYSWEWYDGSVGRVLPGNDVLHRSEIPTA